MSKTHWDRPAHFIGSELCETMVFHDSGRRCEIEDCHCGGLPEASSYRELDFEGYQTASEAAEGHARMLAKFRGM